MLIRKNANFVKYFMKKKIENTDLNANLLCAITNELQAANNMNSNLILQKKIKFKSVINKDLFLLFNV